MPPLPDDQLPHGDEEQYREGQPKGESGKQSLEPNGKHLEHDAPLEDHHKDGGAFGKTPDKRGIEDRKSPFEPHIDPKGELRSLPTYKYQEASLEGDLSPQGAKPGNRTLEI